jgi:hypothetical protein
MLALLFVVDFRVLVGATSTVAHPPPFQTGIMPRVLYGDLGHPPKP